MKSFLFIPEIVFTDEATVWLFDNNHEGWFHVNSTHELSIDKHAGKVHIFGAVNVLLGKVYCHIFLPYLNLNPMENIWKVLKQKVRKQLPQNVQSLQECIENEWENLNDQKIMDICYSFVNRIDKCIDLDGYQIPY